MSVEQPVGERVATPPARRPGDVTLEGRFAILEKLDPARHGHAFWEGVRRLVGGTLAVNIVPALHVLGASLGGTMQSVITKLIG